MERVGERLVLPCRDFYRHQRLRDVVETPSDRSGGHRSAGAESQAAGLVGDGSAAIGNRTALPDRTACHCRDLAVGYLAAVADSCFEEMV